MKRIRESSSSSERAQPRKRRRRDTPSTSNHLETEPVIIACPESGCRSKMIGDDDAELKEFMSVHADLKHRKNFEETHLGRLPLEILFKILDHAAPKKCFQHILKLGLVCRRMNELVKVARVHKEIQLTTECCPLPSKKVFSEMLKSSGAQLKVTAVNWRDSVEHLSHALQKHGHVVQEIVLKKVGFESEENAVGRFEGYADILNRLIKINPEALTRITSDIFSFTLTKRKGNEAFHTRILDFSFQYGVIRRQTAIFAKMATHALQDLQSVQKVTLNTSSYFRVNSNSDSAEDIQIFQDTMESLNPHLRYDMSWAVIREEQFRDETMRQEIEITITRSGKLGDVKRSFPSPGLRFKTFLKYIRDFRSF